MLSDLWLGTSLWWSAVGIQAGSALVGSGARRLDSAVRQIWEVEPMRLAVTFSCGVHRGRESGPLPAWGWGTILYLHRSAPSVITLWVNPRLGGLTNRRLFSHSLGGWKSKIKVSADLVSPEPSPIGLQMSAIPGASQCIQIPSSYKDPCQIELGPTLMSYFNLITSITGSVSKYSHIWRYWGLALQHTYSEEIQLSLKWSTMSRYPDKPSKGAVMKDSESFKVLEIPSRYRLCLQRNLDVLIYFFWSEQLCQG